MKVVQKNSRGFAIVALQSPKFAANVGTVLRAAGCYGVAQVNISNSRAKDCDFKANTSKSHRHMPTFMVDSVLDYLPVKTKVVAVELVSGAVPLNTFKHPERAVYVFGGEDSTLGHDVLNRADHVIYIPTVGCMNLACAVNVVLYDRQVKASYFDDAYMTPEYSYDRKQRP